MTQDLTKPHISPCSKQMYDVQEQDVRLSMAARPLSMASPQKLSRVTRTVPRRDRKATNGFKPKDDVARDVSDLINEFENLHRKLQSNSKSQKKLDDARKLANKTKDDLQVY